MILHGGDKREEAWEGKGKIEELHIIYPADRQTRRYGWRISISPTRCTGGPQTTPKKSPKYLQRNKSPLTTSLSSQFFSCSYKKLYIL